jgi:hypothetical protein
MPEDPWEQFGFTRTVEELLSILGAIVRLLVGCLLIWIALS